MSVSSGVPPGHYELEPKNFATKVKSQKDGTFVTWDLKEVVPDLFSGSDKISKTLHKIWRKVLDHVVKDAEGGFYSYEDGTVIKVYFEKANKALSKAKIDVASREVQKIVKAKIDVDGDGAEVSIEDGEPTGPKKVGGDAALSAVIAEGLKDNATLKEFNFWGDRIIRDLQTGNVKNKMPEEAMKNAQKVKTAYFPLWNAAAQAVSGNCVAVAKVDGLTGEVLTFRKDLGLLVRTCLEIQRLLSDNIKTLVILPVHAGIFSEKTAFELYCGLLANLHSSVYDLLVFEIKDIPSDGLGPKEKRGIEELSKYSRALTVNGGIYAQPDYSAVGFQPHAYGFDLSEFTVPEDEVLVRIGKYGANYKKKGIKCFIKGIESAEAARRAEEAGFLYIAGSAIAKPLPKCIGVKKITLDQLLKMQV